MEDKGENYQKKVLADHLATQMLLSKISTRLLQANNHNCHQFFKKVLKFLGLFCGADRCFLLQKKKQQPILFVLPMAL